MVATMTRLADAYAAWQMGNRPKNKPISVTRLRIAVEAWWCSRLDDGCQLSDLSVFKEWYDWRGKDKWKDGVTIKAMWGDFIHISDIHISPFRFWIAVRPMMGPIRSKSIPARYLNDDGSLFLRPRRRFVLFRALDIHRKEFPARYT